MVVAFAVECAFIDGWYFKLPPLLVVVRDRFVVGDNMWFWRADHTASGTADIQYNPVRNGLVVRGDDVTMYGLAVEHALEDLVQWSGERGCVCSLVLFFHDCTPNAF